MPNLFDRAISSTGAEDQQPIGVEYSSLINAGNAAIKQYAEAELLDAKRQSAMAKAVMREPSHIDDWTTGANALPDGYIPTGSHRRGRGRGPMAVAATATPGDKVRQYH
jgi:hypothetical protein